MECDKSLVFRLEKRGSRYTAYYSKDGNEFTLLGMTDVVLSNVQVGLIASNGSRKTRGMDRLAAILGQSDRQDESPFEMGCDYFNIRSSGLKLP
jgi:hypothetical protein